MQQGVLIGKGGGSAFQRFELVVEQPAQQRGLGLRQEGVSGAAVDGVEDAVTNPFLGVGSRALIGGQDGGTDGRTAVVDEPDAVGGRGEAEELRGFGELRVSAPEWPGRPRRRRRSDRARPSRDAGWWE